ncbi:hypothetical protein J6590_084353 [Homalodisca vitripennis]|nr:hypothetical protein J6590_084353 [Homalodisca vitripennis]
MTQRDALVSKSRSTGCHPGISTEVSDQHPIRDARNISPYADFNRSILVVVSLLVWLHGYEKRCGSRDLPI